MAVSKAVLSAASLVVSLVDWMVGYWAGRMVEMKAALKADRMADLWVAAMAA